MSARIPRITTTVKQAPREGATCQYYLSNQGDQKMAKEIYGCACCSPEFGKIFNGNKKVSELSSMNPSEISVNRDHLPWMGALDRRTFLKGSLVAAGTAVAQEPGAARTRGPDVPPSALFTGSPTASWRIPITADGLYRLSYEDLAAAGVPVTGTAPAAYHLAWRGQAADQFLDALAADKTFAGGAALVGILIVVLILGAAARRRPAGSPAPGSRPPAGSAPRRSARRWRPGR